MTDSTVRYRDTELVFGLVTPVGTDCKPIQDVICDRLTKSFNYRVEVIRVSSDVIGQYVEMPDSGNDEYKRIDNYMTAGNRLRQQTHDNGILAKGVVSKIFSKREQNDKPRPRTAYIVNSLKHPEEVTNLRAVYGNGFYLLSIASDEDTRRAYLTSDLHISNDNAQELLNRDQNEEEGHGQHTRDTFQMGDFFIDLNADRDQTKRSIWRILDLLFGNPYLTPTFDEYAMFMAFAAATRSADLSRQVGAVIARDEEILASGANDCPRPGGGLHWPHFDEKLKDYVDVEKGRDYMRGCDSNKAAQTTIIEGIISKASDEFSRLATSQEHLAEMQPYLDAVRTSLDKSGIKDLTEFGRVVHAEMEALLFCARNTISSRGATLYCTTYPCHNCAKHIIAAGVSKVVYIEPYPKSRTPEFYDEAISESEETDSKFKKVQVVPFVGVGPRKFFDLFSMKLGSGYPLERKDRDGNVIQWQRSSAVARLSMWPFSYLDKEAVDAKKFKDKTELFSKGRVK